MHLLKGSLLALLVLESAALVSCTKTVPREPAAGSRRIEPTVSQGPLGGESPTATVGAASVASQHQTVAAVPVSIPVADLKRRDLSSDKLTFTVRYAGVERKGPVKVEGNQAVMTVADLPVGQAGSFTLTLEDAGVVKLSGTTEDVKLQAGTNTVKITLKPIAPPPMGGDPTKVSFARDLQPTLEKSCGECHQPGKSLDLTQYPVAADVGALTDKMVARATSGDMPPRPRDPVAAAFIQKMVQWKQDGLQP